MRLMLASGSPRRRRLLALLDVPFDVVATDVDETVRPGEAPIDLVLRLAGDKAAAIATAVGDVVLAADTTVDLDGEVLGKPVDGDDARRMLRALAGRTHLVHTAVVARRDGCSDVELVTTAVTMAPIGAAAIDWYVASGEPLDKAGGYAIQGAGGAFVTAIAGSASNVAGLPLATVVELLGRHGLAVGGEPGGR